MSKRDTSDGADLTPARIVSELDRHVVGQASAKRAVAVAIRNRWRRLQLEPELRREVQPRNILLIGSTGVGKTEIARRIADLVGAPFSKVEATKYTEVGYVGRDVESIVRDLLDMAIAMTRRTAEARVASRARERAEGRVLDALVTAWKPGDHDLDPFGEPAAGGAPTMRDLSAVRVRLRERLRSGALDDRRVEIDVREAKGQPLANIFGDPSMAQQGLDFGKLLERMQPPTTKRRSMTVREAIDTLAVEEAEGLVDGEAITADAIRLVEESGIVFLDEIDKVAGREGTTGADVSREGVQRDLLPLVEGTTVSTKHGPVRTDHILFIAAGAFHVAKPSDLLPELQGRFPIRVRLDDLTEEDFVRILEEPEGALTRQLVALLGTEGVKLSFTSDGIREIARVAVKANAAQENIGARRLATVIERVVEDLAFDAPARRGEKVAVDAAYVQERVGPLLEDEDLGAYVL